MKGIESMPITLVAVALLLLIVCYVGFAQIHSFLLFNEKRVFKEQAAGLVQDMKLLKATGNEGSFTTKSIKIPSGYTMVLDLDSDVIASDLSGELYNISLSQIALNMTAFRGNDQNSTFNGTVTLSDPGATIVLHYGSLPESQMRLFTLTFE